MQPNHWNSHFSIKTNGLQVHGNNVRIANAQPSNQLPLFGRLPSQPFFNPKSIFSPSFQMVKHWIGTGLFLACKLGHACIDSEWFDMEAPPSKHSLISAHTTNWTYLEGLARPEKRLCLSTQYATVQNSDYLINPH